VAAAFMSAFIGLMMVQADIHKRSRIACSYDYRVFVLKQITILMAVQTFSTPANIDKNSGNFSALLLVLKLL